MVDLAADAWRLLAADPRFEVVDPLAAEHRGLPLPAAPAAGRDLADDANLYAREALAASGAAVVAGTKVDGRHYLKFTLLNPETTIDDIAHVLDLIAGHAGWYARTARPPPSCPARRLTPYPRPGEPHVDP